MNLLKTAICCCLVAPEVRQCAAKNVVAKPGTETTELSCQLKSNPAPYEVTWYKGYPAEIVQAGSRFFVDNQVINIKYSTL